MLKEKIKFYNFVVGIKNLILNKYGIKKNQKKQ